MCVINDEADTTSSDGMVYVTASVVDAQFQDKRNGLPHILLNGSVLKGILYLLNLGLLPRQPIA